MCELWHGTPVQGVAARARSLAPVLGADAGLLEAAAWLHDIGYAPGLVATGLHSQDGARYLRDAQHADAMLCRLVAHHSCAIIEAGERGLADILSLEFEPAPDALSSVLTFCDMTTSPDRQRQDQRRPHIRIGRHGRSSARIGVVFCRRCEQACDQPDELAAECLRGRPAGL